MKKNRLISMLLCLCMVIAFFAGFAGSASADDVIKYTVQNGDYLFKICRNLGIDYYQCKQAIMILNGFTTEIQLNRISVGQVIKLPATNAVASTVKGTTTTTTTVSTSTTVGSTTTTTTTTSTLSGNLAGYTVAYYLVPHVVVGGETINSICNDLGSSYAQYANVIKGINGLANVNSIQAGSTVLIPTTKAPSSGNCYAVIAHTVANGETVTGICNSYGLNYQNNKTLVNGLNQSINLNKIYAGQLIYVPKPVTASTAVVSTGGTPAGGTTTPTVSNTGYQIAFNTPENGNPYAVVGSVSYATRADAGKAVMIRPNPKDGYAVKGIKVVRTDSGSNIAVTDNGFTMPESNVSITVTYAQGLTIKKETSANGSFDTLVYESAATSAFYGDEVVLRMNPKEGYTVKEVQYQKANGTLAAVKVDKDAASGIYKFKMPNYNIKVAVIFTPITYCYLYDTDSHGNPITGKGTVTFVVDGKTVTKTEPGKTVTVKFTPNTNWKFDKEDFYNYISDSTDPRLTGAKDDKVTRVDDTTYKFVVASDVHVKAVFIDRTKYSLEKKTVTGGSIKFTVTDGITGAITKNATTARMGDVVEIVPAPENNYVYLPIDDGSYLGTNKYTTLAKTGAILASWTPGKVGYEFIMPDSNVRVTPQFKYDTTQKYVNISVTASDKGTIIVKDGNTDSAKQIKKILTSATEFYIHIKPIANYMVSMDKNGNPAVYVNDKNNSITLETTLSDGTVVYKYAPTKMTDSVVKASFKLAYDTVNITATNSDTPDGTDGGIESVYYYDSNLGYNVEEHVQMSINGQHVASGSDAIVNSKVVLKFTLKAGKELVEVRKTGGSGDEKVLLPDGDGKYSYKLVLADTAAPVVFTVKTKSAEVKQYLVQYSDPNTSYGKYTISVDGGTRTSANMYAAEGQKIRLEIIPADKDHTFNQVIIDGHDISKADIVPATDTSYAYYEFTMPAHDVKTQVTFKEVETAPVTTPVAITYSGTNLTWVDKVDEASSGSTISVKIKCDAGYIIHDYNIGVTGGSDKTLSGPDSDGYYTLTFTVTGSSVYVSAPAVKPRLTVIYDNTQVTVGYYIPEYLAGTNVSIPITVISPYEITSITGVPGTFTGSAFEFTMPAEDITITINSQAHA